MTLILAILAHLLYDFHWQGSFIADNKGKYPFLMCVHALTWALLIQVVLIYSATTRWWSLPVLFVTHAVTDWWKARLPRTPEWFWALYVDQTIHFATILLVLLSVGALAGSQPGTPILLTDRKERRCESTVNSECKQTRLRGRLGTFSASSLGPGTCSGIYDAWAGGRGVTFDCAGLGGSRGNVSLICDTTGGRGISASGTPVLLRASIEYSYVIDIANGRVDLGRVFRHVERYVVVLNPAFVGRRFCAAGAVRRYRVGVRGSDGIRQGGELPDGVRGIPAGYTDSRTAEPSGRGLAGALEREACELQRPSDRDRGPGGSAARVLDPLGPIAARQVAARRYLLGWQDGPRSTRGPDGDTRGQTSGLDGSASIGPVEADGFEWRRWHDPALAGCEVLIPVTGTPYPVRGVVTNRQTVVIDGEEYGWAELR